MGLFDWLRGFGGVGASVGTADEAVPPEADEVEGPVEDVVGGCPAGFRAEAEDLVGYWNEYDLDYRASSLSRLDSLTARQRARSDYVRAETDAGDPVAFRPAATGSACYFGEVLVRSYDGAWTEADDGWVVTVEGPEGRTPVDVFAVAHVCLDGDASFVDAADAALREVGRDERV
jgi:hypothetical protein